MADIYGNVSSAGGFDQSEIDFVTNLINSGQVSVADVAKQFGLPESIISAAYEANRPAAPAPEILQPSGSVVSGGSFGRAAPAPAPMPISIPSVSQDFALDPGVLAAPAPRTSTTTAQRAEPTGFPVVVAAPPAGGFSGNTGERAFDPRGDIFAPPDVGSGEDVFQTGLDYQDRLEEAEDEEYQAFLRGLDVAESLKSISPEGGFSPTEIDYVTQLVDSGAVSIDEVATEFGLAPAVVEAAYNANQRKPLSSPVNDLLEDWLSPTDTKNEFLEDIAAANKKVTNAMSMPITADATDSDYQTQIEENLTNISTAKQERDILVNEAIKSGLVDQGDIDEAFGPTLAETALEGLSDVLGAGTRGLYDVASNVPVVGDFLGDAVEGAADWLKNMEGTLTVNPITGTVQGTWGEVPPWMEKQTVTQVGQIPGSQTIGGVTTGTILDDFISVGRGEQDLEDVFEERGGEIASTVGIDPAIVAAAQAAGKTVKEFLEDQNAKETALAPTTEEDPKEKEKAPAVVDLSGGRDDEEPAAQEVATITPSTSDGTSLPEGVAGPLFVPDTEVTLEEVLEDPIDRTPTGREIVPGFQLPEEPVAEEVDIVEEVIKQTPTERERLPGFQLPEEPVAEEVDIVEEVIKQTPTGREIVPGFQLPEEPVVEPPVLEPPVLEEEPVVEPPVLEEEPVVEPPVVEEEPVVEPPVLEEEPVFEPPVVEEEPVVEPPVLEEEPVFEPPVLEEEPVFEPPVLEEEPATPEVPEIPTSPTMQGYRAVQTKPGGLVDIDYLYDIAGPSIFAPKMQGEAEEDVLAYLYSNLGDSGIVQDYDIEELIRLLESQRG